jgi:outer membrane protein
MKRKIMVLAIAVTAFATSVNAQQGGVLVYGNFGIMSQTHDDGGTKTKVMNGMFSPGIGYGVNDKLIVGLNIGLSSQKTDPDGPGDVTTTNFSAGPFVRYTQSLSDIFTVYGQANASFLSGVTKYSPGSSKDKTSGVDVNITPNFGINLGKGWGLNFGFGSLGFTSTTAKPDDGGSDDKIKDSSFGLALNGNTLRWGVSYMFNCAKK